MNGEGKRNKKSVPDIGQYYWLILVILEVHVDIKDSIHRVNLLRGGGTPLSVNFLLNNFHLLPFILLRKVLFQIYQNMPQNVLWDKNAIFGITLGNFTN